MTMTQPRSNRLGQKLPRIPATWIGSDLEFYTYLALIKLGYKLGVDFEMQVGVNGGRLQAGGSVSDFTLPNLRVILLPQGAYWHHRTADQRAHDTIQRIQLESQGWRVEYPQEDDLLNNYVDVIRRCIAGTYGRGPVG